MVYRLLGTSALRVSAIGFGCMSLKDEQEAARVIHHAVEAGINFFDTADLYDKGMNEEWLGRILRGRRAEVLLATKVGNQWRGDGSGWDWNPRKDYIIQAVEGSLRRLQTDRIDLYQLHGGTLDDPIDETIEAFELLQQQGKIRYYGLSSIRPNVIREYVRRSKITSVMMQYSLLDRRPEESCLELLMQRGIGVLARGVLAKGLLAGKAAIAYPGHGEEAVQKAAEMVRSIAGEQRAMSDIAIGYVLGHPAVGSAVVGVRTEEQLEQLLRGGGGVSLSVLEMEKLADSISSNRYETFR
jgi:aryl-alcohol dehydrogenase-like predicted oxidoreductase